MGKILVIEDQVDILDDVVETLKLEGYDVLRAECGEDGVQLAREELPDLIVCDIMMPNMDGYQVLEILRSETETSTIPFIFLTALAERANWRQGMVMGADDYVTKPFHLQDLLESIQAQFHKQELIDDRTQEQLDVLRNSIVLSLPHELRTPLNSIIGFSDMLVSEADHLSSEQVSNWAQHISKAAERLYRLVENHLYYVRLQVSVQGGARLTTDDALIDFNSAIEAEAQVVAEEHRRTDDIVLDLETVPMIKMQANDAQKVVHELIDNGFKFSEAGTPVRIIGRATQSGYRFTVADEGRGMSQKDIDQIGAYIQFERWIYEQQGMGLGLTIVKLLSQGYSTEFEIKSQKDVPGTQVSFTFPGGSE
jgi:K+-sensing histidine kinase KdpD